MVVMRPETAADELAASAAMRRYEERLAKDPASLAFAPLAELYRKAGRTRDAVALCREGLTRFPDYTTARLILAKSLLDDGDADGALAEARAILAASPADAAAHRLAGELLRRAGRLEEALVHVRQAVALDPADRESRALLDVLAGGALAEGSALRRLLVDDTFVTHSFGAACLEQGLADEAAQIYVRLVRKDAADVRARERLDQALRMKTQRRKGP
jgi:tetratricopeptide (TPR) repeat protein